MARLKYPSLPEATLLVGSWWSYCNACGKGAFPNQTTHDDISSYTPEKGGGCGIEWKYVYSEYIGDQAEKATQSLRPDLEYISHNIERDATGLVTAIDGHPITRS